MEWLFGHKKTPQEMLRENQRMLNKAIRELDRERTKLEAQEKKTMMDLKKAAKAGQMDVVKIMAKDVVRTRNYVKKMIMMKTQIQAVSLKIQTLKSTNAMAQAMKGVTKAMSRMNNQMNIPEMQKIMAEFEKQNEIMDMKQEMMDDTVDDVLAEEDEEAESEGLVRQIFDELNLSMAGEMASTPMTENPNASKAQVASPDADLQARLDSLRRD